jgi:uncharacterized FAD-dependent dehydrogenase
MQQKIQLIVSPEQAAKEVLLKRRIAEKLGVSERDINYIRVTKKSIDARTHQAKINLSAEVFINEDPNLAQLKRQFEFKDVHTAKSVLIIGAGPAGLFAALKLLELGLKPVIVERGKQARDRISDIAALNRNKSFNQESNYCYGEGGAGTFSDGKLYTRSKKKGDAFEVLELFHYHGAADDILYEAHPHIGSDLLPQIVGNMSYTITSHGGEIYFETKMKELIIENNRATGCVTEDGRTFKADAVILATGHSAHDIFEMLHEQGIQLEQKGFAMGVRVEHPQSLIDSIQYHCPARGEYLPAANYSLVEQIDDRGVYSFCMCPGGRIVPAGTTDKEIVVNGMSGSRRNSAFANSGMVVEIRPEDIPTEFQQHGVLAGLRFQQHVEHLAYLNNGGKGQMAPAQRLIDFVKGRVSSDLPECSYMPGIISSPLHFWLPEHISWRLREAFRRFDRKMRGYLTNDAVVVAVESRSSSSVRIPRDSETGQHPQVKGLFPAGEGSGFSGGITSSAIDGQNAALRVYALLK